MGAYAPTLIASFGYNRLKANAMASISSWGLFVLNVVWGLLADKFQRRGLFILLAVVIYWGFTVRTPLPSYLGQALKLIPPFLIAR